MEIAVIGKGDFCLGFRLAGIKKVFETQEPSQSIAKIRHDGTTGIVIFDENLRNKLSTDDKEIIDNSIKPIFISVSAEASEDTLKQMIKKSIGVDL